MRYFKVFLALPFIIAGLVFFGVAALCEVLGLIEAGAGWEAGF